MMGDRSDRHRATQILARRRVRAWPAWAMLTGYGIRFSAAAVFAADRVQA
jgi:hypothetical protein